MQGLYCWGDLNIYLILFRASFENTNQPRSKARWWWWSAFEWELVNILQFWTTHTKNIVSRRYLSKIKFRQIHNYILFNCDELDLLFSEYINSLNFVINGLFTSCNITNSYIVEYLDHRQHCQYLMSNNSQLTESQIFQLQDE